MIKKLIFGGAGGGSALADVGLLILRLIPGLSMAFAHGLGKLKNPSGPIQDASDLGFPVPVVFGSAAVVAEFFGGLLVAIGLATRPAAFLILCTMTTAAFVVHADHPFKVKELALLYFSISLALMLIGPGRFSVDRAIAGK